MSRKPEIWILLDDRAGSRSQCLGVADALGLPYRRIEFGYTFLARLPNRILGASFLGVNQQDRSKIAPPWPDLVISAGRRTAPVARGIRKLSNNAAKLVHLMWPGSGGSSDFALIAVPGHDPVRSGRNTIRTLGAPHTITPDTLKRLRSEWASQVSGLPEPRLALVVGGSTKNRTFTREMARELGSLASQMAADLNGSLLVTTSRRTGDAEPDLVSAIECPARIFRWGDGGNNPYPAYLALADGVIVTGDSMSMCTEACMVDGPVYIYAPDALITPKHNRLHEALFSKGYARPLSGAYDDWSHPPLNCANEIADVIRTQVLELT